MPHPHRSHVPPPDAASSVDPVGLDTLPTGAGATIVAVVAPHHGAASPADGPDWARQLGDLGFLPGEPVRLVRRTWLGGDPLVVRVAGGTYALRRAEAACVRVRVRPPGDGAAAGATP